MIVKEQMEQGGKKVVLEMVTEDGTACKKTMTRDEALRLAGQLLDVAVNYN